MGRPPLRAPIPYGQGSHIRTSSLPETTVHASTEGGGARGRGERLGPGAHRGHENLKRRSTHTAILPLVQDKKLEYRRQRKS